MALGYDGSIRVKANLDQSQFNKGLASMEAGIGKFANTIKRFAGMVGIAFGTAALVAFGKEAVNAASQLSNAWQGLQSIVEGQGRSFSAAQGFINDYISDGLVPLENAVTAYKNLAARGYDDTQIQKTLTALKDAAAFGRQASYSLGDAVTSATEGLKNENSILVDNAGVTKNVAKMWDDYAASIGTTSNNLTQEQKIQAEVNGILEETRFQTGDAAKVAGTYSGQVSSLSYSFQQLKVSVGNALLPIVQAVLPGINSVIKGLTTLANVFAQVTSLLFGKKAATVGTDNAVAAAGASAAEATNDVADAQKNAGSAAKQAAKDMKGVLASFDELNVIATETAGSVGGAADGINSGAGGIDIPQVDTSGEVLADVTISPKIQKFIDNLRKSLKPTKEALQGIRKELERLGSFAWEGLKDFYNSFLVPIGQWVMGEGIPRFVDAITNGLAAVDWSKINDALHQLWEALAPFAVTVGEGLLWLWENVLVPFGTWVMNEAIPVFLDLLAAGLEFLNEIIIALEPAATWLLENFLQPFAEFVWDGIVEGLTQFTDLLRDLSEVLNGGMGLGEFIEQLTPLQTVILAVVAVAAGLMIFNTVSSVISTAKDVFSALGDVINWVFGPGSTIAGIAAIIGGAVLSITNFLDMLENGFSWANEALMLLGIAITAVGAIILGAPAFIAGVVAAIVAVVATIAVYMKEHWEEIKSWWNEDIAPKIEQAINGIKEIFGGIITFLDGVFNLDLETAINGIKQIFQGLQDFVGGIWSTIETIFTGALDWLDQVTGGRFSNTIESIKSIFSGISETASTIIESVKGIFNGLITFFTGAFTGDWSKAWEGIKEIVGNVWNGIWGTIAGVVNTIIGGIESFLNLFVDAWNTVFGWLNSLSIDIPDWVPGIGGGTLGFSIPTLTPIQIPRLANGAVIPPNQQFMAILGDQRSGTNIEAPLATIEQALQNVLDRSNVGGEINITVESVLDGKVVARNTVKHINDMTRSAGKPVLVL